MAELTYEHQLYYPTFRNRRTGEVMPNDTRWQDHHKAAVHTPNTAERGVVYMLRGWALYADRHRAAYGSKVGDDGVLGEEWEAIGRGIRGLLNGETGRLDCGTLDAFIVDTLESEGFKTL